MPARGGRPAGPTDDTAEQVLQAAFRLLATEGAAALTPVRIHRETGVARTTVYRHWPTPAHIVEAILARAVARHELDELTNDVDHDLGIAVATLTYRFKHRPLRRFYDATRLHGDPSESPTMSERYITGLIAPVRDVVHAAIERGQLEPGDPAALAAEICGPLLLRHLLLGEDLPDEAAAESAERFLAAHRRR